MIAREVMSGSVKTITPLTTLAEAARLMRAHDVGFFPVVDQETSTILLGVVTDRDLVLRALADRRDPDLTVGVAMSQAPLIVARESTDVHELLRLMERHQVRRIPILTADGKLAGIVSQGDLALRMGRAEPMAIEGLLERVSAPSWMLPFLDGAILLPPLNHTS